MLSSAATLAAGIIGTVGITAAHAATTVPGSIAYRQPDGQVGLMNSSGVSVGTVSGISPDGSSIAWAPDGSRLVINGPSLVSSEISGQGEFTLPSDSGTLDPAFGYSGSAVLTDSSGVLYTEASDGASARNRLLSSSQEPSTVCDTTPSAAPDWVIAFTRTACSGGASSIWTYNPITNAVGRLIPNASDPVFSSDGSKLVFLEQVAGEPQVFTAKANGTGVTQLTDEPGGASSPSLSSDGSTLAYTTGSVAANTSVIKTLSLTTVGATPVVLGSGSLPVWQPLLPNALDRVYGTGGQGTDIAGSRWDYNTTGGKTQPGLITAFNAVLLNRSDSADAPSAIALAGEKQAPLLMTSGGSLDTNTANELKRTLHKGWTVYLQGSTSELSAKLASQVQALGFSVVRISAGDPTTESVDTAKYITNAPTWVTITDTMDYRTAIAAAAQAASSGYHGRTVVLVNNSWSLPSSIQAYLNSLNPSSTHVLTVGSRSTSGLSNAQLNKVWNFWYFNGSNGETLAEQLASFWWGGEREATLANNSNWQDSAVGAADAGTYGPLLWTSTQYLSPDTVSFLNHEAASISNVQMFGTDGIPVNTVTETRAAISYNASGTQIYYDPNGLQPAFAPAFHAAVSAPAAAVASHTAGIPAPRLDAAQQLTTKG